MEEVYYAFNPWWEGKDFDVGILRDEYLNKIGSLLNRKQINIIIGSRRVGKTTLIRQLIKQVLNKEINPNQILYLALDHPRLSNVSILEHLKMFRKIFVHNRDKKLFLFLDEIQEVASWESELKAIYDLENVKIVASGSTSSLIKSQGGKLTGRQIITTLYPLNFKEFLLFRKEKISKAEDYKYEKLVEEYLNIGGYPENVLSPSEEYLHNLLEDIIARDLIRLFPIKKPNVLKDLLRLLSSAVSSRISFNKLSKVLHITVDTVREYINYFETAFLVKTMEKWSTSWTDKIYASKKIYFIDTGIKTLFTGKGDLGAKSENAVFMHLLRKNIPCGYYAESEKEVDFILGSFKKPEVIECKYISDFNYDDKKLSGVKLFLRRYHETQSVSIITCNIEDEIKNGKTKITLIPLWKFLIEE